MFRKISPESAKDLIKSERAIVRVLQSDPGDYSNLEFEFNQYADPENNRPVRPLEEKADRNYIYDHKLKDFVKRELQRKERGLPQPGNLRIKAVSGTLLPTDGNMRLYNHALSNQSHKHVIYGVDAGVDPDRYLYLHKQNPEIDVSTEACLIVSCFTKDAGTNTKWHIKGQPLNAYHAGVYPEPVSFQQLREHNRTFVKNRTKHNRHKDERNEVKFKASVAALRFVGAVSDDIADRLNALHFKIFILEKLHLDLPIYSFTEEGVVYNDPFDQATDIIKGLSFGIHYAFDIHDKLQRLGASLCQVAENYFEIFPLYQDYVQQMKVINSDISHYRFLTYHLKAVYGNKLENNEEKDGHIESKVTRRGDYSCMQHADATEAFQSNPIYPHCISDAKASVLSRKTWSDIVSKTDTYNATEADQGLDEKIIQRMIAKGVTGDTTQIYKDMLLFLQEQTRIILGFETKDVIGNVPVGLHSLNRAEMRSLGLKKENETYFNGRKTVENTTFHFIPEIEKQFENHIGARPHYAFLTLANWHNNPTLLRTGYGTSYLVLRQHMKLNSVFVPHNIVNEGKQATPCSYFHFEVLLHQASDALLFGLVNAVSGQLPDQRIKEHAGYEMHAYFPPINLFDGNVVERIYVDPNEYKLSADEKQFIEKRGIHVCPQTETSAYAEEKKQLLAAVSAGDVTQYRQLLQRYPFLKPSMDDALTSGLKGLYDMLLKVDTDRKPATWQTLLATVPLKSMHLFLNQWSQADLLELCSPWENEIMLSFFTGKQGVLSDVTWNLFLNWVTQFEKAKAGCAMEFVAMLWEYAIAHHDQNKLKSLLKAGFYQRQYAPLPLPFILTNPKLQSVTHFIITEKHYELTHTELEREQLVMGGNYWFIQDVKYLDNLLSQKNADSHCCGMLSSFLQFAETRNQVDSLILLMHHKGLLKDLRTENINELIGVAVQNKKTEMAMLTLLVLTPPSGVSYATRLIECKASPALVQFSLGVVCQPIVSEEKPEDLVSASLPYFSVETFDVKHAALGLYALARLKKRIANAEEKSVDHIVTQVEAYPAEIKHALIFELMEYYPTTLDCRDIVNALLFGLPNFDFLQTPTHVVYSSFDYLAVYFQGFLKQLLATTEQVSDFLAEGAIFYALRPDMKQHDHAITYLENRPALKNRVRATDGNSLLHCAMMRRTYFTKDYVRAFVDCAGASQRNHAGVTSLLIAIRYLPPHDSDALELANAYYGAVLLSKTETIKLLLRTVAYTPEMIIEAMCEVITSENPDFEMFDVLCQRINSLPLTTRSDSLSQCFLTAFDRPHRKLWVPFLKNTTLTSETLTEGFYRYIANLSGSPHPEIDGLLDRCSQIKLSHALYGKLAMNNIAFLSKIVARDQCVIDSTLENVLWSVLLQELKGTRGEAYDLNTVLTNLIHALKKYPTFAENQKNVIYLTTAIKHRPWVIANLLVAEEFSLSDPSLHLVVKRYIDEILNGKTKTHTVLVSLLKALPHKPITFWKEIYAIKSKDVAVPDSACKIRDIRLLACQFENDFYSQDETIRAPITEDVQTTIRAILHNRAVFQLKMKAFILREQWVDVVELIGGCIIKVKARENLSRFENVSDSSEEKVTDAVRLQRFASGKAGVNQNITDMIMLFGKKEILLEREKDFITRVRELVPIYFSRMFVEIRLTSGSAPPAKQLLQLIQCYYLLDLYDQPDSVTTDVDMRETFCEKIAEVIEPIKACMPSIMHSSIGLFATKNVKTRELNAESEEEKERWENGR